MRWFLRFYCILNIAFLSFSLLLLHTHIYIYYVRLIFSDVPKQNEHISMPKGYLRLNLFQAGNVAAFLGFYVGVCVCTHKSHNGLTLDIIQQKHSLLLHKGSFCRRSLWTNVCQASLLIRERAGMYNFVWFGSLRCGVGWGWAFSWAFGCLSALMAVSFLCPCNCCLPFCRLRG